MQKCPLLTVVVKIAWSQSVEIVERSYLIAVHRHSNHIVVIISKFILRLTFLLFTLPARKFHFPNTNTP